VQALDLGYDQRFCCHPLRVVSRQCAGDLLEVLEPHGNVEPV